MIRIILAVIGAFAIISALGMWLMHERMMGRMRFSSAFDDLSIISGQGEWL
jgi:hypothetical protein